MRKEENLELIKKLAASRIDTGLLKSSRTLGSTKTTKRDLLNQALNESQAGITVEKNRDILFETPRNGRADPSESEDSSVDGQDEKAINRSKSMTAMVGSGLKRALETDSDGNPIVKKRKRTRSIREPQGLDGDDVSSWNGFSPSEESVHSLSSESMPNSSNADNTDLETGSESESDISSSNPEGSLESTTDRKARSSAFKAWATSQVNEALGFTPATATHSTEPNNSSTKAVKLQIEPRAPDIDPLPPELGTESQVLDRKIFSVPVNRTDQIQGARMELPVLAEEQRIMEAIHNSSTVVICGETGSGKTTQVPQFLYEAGFGHQDGPHPGMVGITQPRRVAAISMSNRVGAELCDQSRKIAHQVRFDSSVSRETAIKFMTDGILVREIAKDFLLSGYSAIIVDEAHERSINTDILIGLLSRIVDLRESLSKEDNRNKPLKLIIMSATLRIQDFVENKMLFRNGPPPLVQVEGRQHPVTIHFSRKTQLGYVDQSFQKVSRGHRLLPPGSMLVFLTSQDEIMTLARRLKKAFSTSQDDGTIMDGDADNLSEDDDKADFMVDDHAPSSKTPGVHVLPLYSQLKTEEQLRVFGPSPEGSRMIVLATNVAETSLTIPGIRYVFDCGRVKEKRYGRTSGVQSFEVGWISKASASQRAGRAGRIGPGHCYRLYSSAVYERDFEEHAEPEITRMPVEGVVLQLKSMELHNVINFPFPTPPDRQSLAKAEKLLMYLGALTNEGKITSTGRGLSAYPLSPRYAKMLAVGHQFKCTAFTILLVAALATPNIFIPENVLGLVENKNSEIYTNEEDLVAHEARLKKRNEYNHAQKSCSKHSRSSDGLKAFTALQGYIKTEDKDEHCEKLYLSPKAMQEANCLVNQLTSLVSNLTPLHLSTSTGQLSVPSKDQIAALQQFIVAGFVDQIAIQASDVPSPPYLGRSPKRAIDVPYLPLFPIKKDRPTSETDIRDIAVYIHPSSILAHHSPKEVPKYIIYSHLQRANPATIGSVRKPRTRMHPLTVVTEKTILLMTKGTPLLEYGKPLSILEERVGEKGKERICVLQPSLVGEKSSLGWPLPAQKVVQIRNAKGEWIVQ